MTTIFETTDAAGTRFTTYEMTTGDVFRGTVTASDLDYVRLSLTAGQTITFGAVGIGGAGSGLHDPLMRLRDSNNTVLLSNDDGGPGLTSKLTFTAATTGTYYIQVSGAQGSTGNYGLAMSAGGQLSLDPELGAAVLYREQTTWPLNSGSGASLSFGFLTSGPAVDAQDYAAPFSALTVAQKDAARAALQAFSDVANLTFQEVAPTSATIRFGAYTSTTDGAGAYANFPGSTAPSSTAGDLWLNRDSVTDDFSLGSYDWATMLHELGHVMGLDHPGDYNATLGQTITYANSAQFLQDSEQFTVMSYFDAVATTLGAPRLQAQTLMMLDIRALQVMYGVNTAFHATDTVYGFHATQAGSVYDFTTNTRPLMCIWDGGGTDWLDLSGATARQRIDLRAGSFSDVMGFKNNLSIAVDCTIENVVGGRWSDVIIGNAAANRIKGMGAADTLDGGAGNDFLTGGAGADVFVFHAGNGFDKVMDFNPAEDRLQLSADLWGGVARTAAEVVSSFARMVAGHVALDFGTDELHLMTLTSTVGLSDHILIV